MAAMTNGGKSSWSWWWWCPPPPPPIEEISSFVSLWAIFSEEHPLRGSQFSQSRDLATQRPELQTSIWQAFCGFLLLPQPTKGLHCFDLQPPWQSHFEGHGQSFFGQTQVLTGSGTQPTSATQRALSGQIWRPVSQSWVPLISERREKSTTRKSISRQQHTSTKILC
jgi:hypothetical protein